MRKQITYLEPYFDPHTHIYDHSQMTRYTVIAESAEEFEAHMAAITNPAREIPGDSIIIEELPSEINPAEQLRADIDYLSIMTGVDL